MSFNDRWAEADPDAAGGGRSEPPELGLHQAMLLEARAFTSKKGEDWVALGWQRVGDGYEWDYVLGFGTQGAANLTKRECRELGVDITGVTSLEELDAQLKGQLGSYFDLEVAQNGDYRNTYVRGRAGTADPGFNARVDDAREALREQVPAVADDDIPF